MVTPSYAISAYPISDNHIRPPAGSREARRARQLSRNRFPFGLLDLRTAHVAGVGPPDPQRSNI